MLRGRAATDHAPWNRVLRGRVAMDLAPTDRALIHVDRSSLDHALMCTIDICNLFICWCVMHLNEGREVKSYEYM